MQPFQKRWTGSDEYDYLLVADHRIDFDRYDIYFFRYSEDPPASEVLTEDGWQPREPGVQAVPLISVPGYAADFDPAFKAFTDLLESTA